MDNLNAIVIMAYKTKGKFELNKRHPEMCVLKLNFSFYLITAMHAIWIVELTVCATTMRKRCVACAHSERVETNAKMVRQIQ